MDKATIRAELAARELARRNYGDYLRYVHGAVWKPTRMASFLAQRVQAFLEGQTGNAYDILIIETPPQHGKSMAVTESLPAWYLGKYPERRVILGSYNETSAERFARRNKEKIKAYGKTLFGVSVGKVDRTTEAEYDAEMAQMATKEEQWAAEFDYDTRQADLKEAGQALLDLGVMPSDSQLAALGYTRGQAEAYMAAAKLQSAQTAKTAKTSASTTKSATQSNKPGGEYALYLAAKESGGDPRTYVKNHYKEYGLTALPTEKAYQTWAASLKEPLGQEGMETFLAKVNISLSEDTVAATNAMVFKYWPSLTEGQRQKVQEVYEKYGKSYAYNS